MHTEVVEKVAVIIPRLESKDEKEVFSAVREIGFELARAGHDWTDLAAKLIGWPPTPPKPTPRRKAKKAPPPPPPQPPLHRFSAGETAAAACLLLERPVSDNAKMFLQQVLRKADGKPEVRLSSRQARWLAEMVLDHDLQWPQGRAWLAEHPDV